MVAMLTWGWSLWLLCRLEGGACGCYVDWRVGFAVSVKSGKVKGGLAGVGWGWVEGGGGLVVVMEISMRGLRLLGSRKGGVCGLSES